MAQDYAVQIQANIELGGVRTFATSRKWRAINPAPHRRR
jgi:hypothetical protein